MYLGHCFPGGSMVKNPPVNPGDKGDTGLIPGSEKSPGGGHGKPLQYFCLENFMDRGAWQATGLGLQKSDTTQQLHHHQWLMRVSQVALVGKYPLVSAGDIRLGFDPWVRKIPYRTTRQPTLVFLPGESYGERRLVATVHKVVKSWTQLCTLWTWHSDLAHMHAMTNDTEHLLMCLLLICILLWKNIRF